MRVRNYFLGLFLVCFCACSAQKKSSGKMLAKAEEQFNLAQEQIDNGFLKQAIPFFEEAIKINPNYVAAYLSLAGVYQQLQQYDLSEQVYLKAFVLDSINTKTFLLSFSTSQAGLGKFQQALKSVQDFFAIEGLSEKSIKTAYARKRNYEFAIDYSRKYSNIDYTFNPINLGDSINTKSAEYYPSLSVSDSLLVFSRRTGGAREDFFKSIMKENNFLLAQEIEGSLNDHPYKGALSVSTDGEFIVYAANYGNDKGFGNFDLYIAYKTKNGWSEPENLGPNVNTGYWETAPSLSPDNRTLYFTSDRQGGFGGRDLYYCTKQPNGKFGKAINMGAVVNSNGDDLYPFICADNQTLFFASNGHEGYGGTDLFLIRKDLLGNWGKPLNLGYPLNTISDEGSICINSLGNTAYFASDRFDTKGSLDIYSFELRKDLRPLKTLFVKGQVVDAITNKGIACAVELYSNDNAQSIMKVTADEQGRYYIALPFGKDYTFIVNRKDYLFYSDVYTLSQEKADSTYTKNIALQPIAINKSLTFKNVVFKNNSFELLPSSLTELDKLVELLQQNSSLKILIKGHTDNVGKPADNLLLSTNRAKAVVEYLVSKNIDISKLQFKGFGDTKPVASNNTEDGRAKNRRTEFEVLSY
jgi:outer membrane protein OmpA-like peptidoglycan-associated protein